MRRPQLLYRKQIHGDTFEVYLIDYIYGLRTLYRFNGRRVPRAVWNHLWARAEMSAQMEMAL